MRAKIRLVLAIAAAGLALGAVPAAAQDAPPAETGNTSTPATNNDAVGPRELQDFNLPGTVTRQADRPAAVPPRPVPTPSAPARSTAPAASSAQPPAREPAATATRPAARGEEPAATTSDTRPAVTTALPPIGDSPADTAAPPPVAEPEPASSGTIAPSNDIPLSWMLAAFAVILGAGFYVWRSRRREAFAGGAGYDAFQSQPEAAPTPAPRPVPAAAPTPAPPGLDSLGLVSTRLRPWLDMAFAPIACAIDDQNVIIDFELALTNSGNAPARAILVEASYFNAGPHQEDQVKAFFANPAGAGERAISLAPLKSMVIRNQVVTPREQVREVEVDGKKFFVPLIAFNALYRWSSGEGQTSTGFMLGRNTKGDKLAPFKLDMAGRTFTDVGMRPLPVHRRD